MDIDAALIAGAIAGGITGGIVAAVISLGVLRSQRHIGGTSIGAVEHSSEWRGPPGPPPPPPPPPQASPPPTPGPGPGGEGAPRGGPPTPSHNRANTLSP